jgi:asparagine synthase (glutamine-hydrolysing)
MCGIAGFVNAGDSSGVSSPARVLARMTDAILHRGPDDSGFYIAEDRVFLGHRRLSIIDLAAGRQPMANEDGTVHIVYNGEIFNHSGVRQELERAGHVYATHCDTEAIIHAYEQYGPDCLKHFRGMFAFALWDSSARRLFCARDRLGKKPFYYYWDGRLFAFASEIKALLQHPAISPAFEHDLLPEYLAFGYISEERTLYSGIRRLMPGHHLTLDLSGSRPSLEIRQYWEIPEMVPDTTPTETEWIGECRRRLEETVEMRLMSDVPLGMFLSGGVDSSAIAALMKRMAPGPVKSFSVGYSEAEYSELGYARQVSGRIGTEHHEVVVGMDDFFNALPLLIWHEDEPITWPSSISLYFVSKLASSEVKVVLTGEGSDELFAGYGRYRFYLWNSRWLDRYKAVPGPLRNRIRQFIGSTTLLNGEYRRKLQHTFVGLGETIESLYIDNFYSALSAEAQKQLGAANGVSPYGSFLRYWDARPHASPLARMLYTDQKTYLVELLMKQDQMSMATSIESRVPFLDHTFVEFAARVPDSMKLRGAEGKYILKKAVEDLVPHDILYRKKMGFPTPIRDWLMDGRAESLYNILRQKDGLLQSYLDPRAMEDLLDRHQRGLEDATDRIWRLLNLQIWGNVCLTGNHDDLQPLLATSGSTAA